MTLQVRNRFLRYVNVYAQFLNANGDVLFLDNPGDQDSDISQLIAKCRPTMPSSGFP